MARLVQSITDLIGDTPLVRLNRVVPEGSAEIYVKLGVPKSRRQCKRPYCHLHDRSS